MDALGLNSNFSAASLSATNAQRESLPEMQGDSEAAGKKFEALIATMLVKEMRKSLPEGFFGKGPGTDSFSGWLDKSIGDNMAESWDLDIAGMVKTSLDAKKARAAAEMMGEVQ